MRNAVLNGRVNEIMPYIHEAYAKQVLQAVFEDRFSETGLSGQRVLHMAGVRIDAVIDSRTAVEIESGTAKVVAADADSSEILLMVATRVASRRFNR